MNEGRLDKLFDLDTADAELGSWPRPWRGLTRERVPRVRIDRHETDGGHRVKAHIPGVRKEDIDVRVDGRQVTVSAEMTRHKGEKKNGRVRRSARQPGYASRSFALASDVDDGRAEARDADGVLDLKLPRKAGRASKRLTVS